MKSTGDEKSRDSVRLSAKADGTKLPPMIVFKGAIRESKTLKKEFKNRCIQKKVRVNPESGSFSFRRCLVLDSYECHIDDEIKALLTSRKVDTSIVPDGCTKF